MYIQPLEQSDIGLITDLQLEGWQDLSIIEFYTLSAFCFPIKVSIDQKIGIGTIIHKDVSWFAHIIIHPGNRNQVLEN